MRKERFAAWFKAAGIRAIKTVAQTAVAVIGASVMLGQVKWITVGSSSLLAGALSLLTSIAGLPELKEAPTAEDIPPQTPDNANKKDTI